MTTCITIDTYVANIATYSLTVSTVAIVYACNPISIDH